MWKPLSEPLWFWQADMTSVLVHCKFYLLCSLNRYKSKALISKRLHVWSLCTQFSQWMQCGDFMALMWGDEVVVVFFFFFFILYWGKSKFLFTFSVLEIPSVCEESESFMSHWRVLNRLCAMGMQWKWMAFSFSSDLKFCLDSTGSDATLTDTDYHFS